MLERNISIVDFKWSADGDFDLENGDIATTSAMPAKGFLQEVIDRIKSSTNDWRLQPRKGANVDDFQGEINNRQTHRRIENAISFALTYDLFLARQDFKVTAAPVSNSQVAVRIDFDTSLTDTVADSTIQVKVIYDTNGKGPFIIR